MVCPFQARVVLYLMLAVIVECITEFVWLNGRGKDGIWWPVLSRHGPYCIGRNCGVYYRMYLWRDAYVRTNPHQNISGACLRNFKIRVGADSKDLGNNPVCHEQQSSVPVSVTEIFTCTVGLYGNWVSVNKACMDETDLLQLREVRCMVCMVSI